MDVDDDLAAQGKRDRAVTDLVWPEQQWDASRSAARQRAVRQDP
jgi:hypothetical protein